MFLGIDIGTSAVKAVLMDEAGSIQSQDSAQLSISRPKPGWSEQSPEEWWTAVNEAVAGLNPKQRSQVQAIGLSGQMHGATLLDAGDHPLRPAILWNDGRSAEECIELELAEPRSRAITGNIAMPGFTAPKLAWVRKHEPEVFAATRRVLLPKDYVRLKMTGETASEMSDAAGTLWLDTAKRTWSEAMLAASGLARSHMPRLVEGSQETGRLRIEVANAWGMGAAPVAGGGGDNAAGAVGVGVINDGDAFLSLGTSGVIFLAGSQFRPNPERAVHAFCHCLPGRWHQMSVMLSAASCLDWAAKLTGEDVGSLNDKIRARARLNGPEIFLPYLSGERTPHNQPDARGVLFGLSHDSDAAAIGQAVIEGVAFGFADGLSALEEAGTRVDQITVIGGGARSEWWGQVLAAALQRTLVYREGSEIGPALGAARLARLCVGGERLETVCSKPPVRAVIEPREASVAMLAAKQHLFKQLYSDLRARFGEASHG